MKCKNSSNFVFNTNAIGWLFVSAGHTLAEDVALFLASGVDHVLPKPLKLPNLKAIVVSKLG